MNLSSGKMKTVLEEKGYRWFQDPGNKGFNLNIIGIRNSSPGNKVTNLFDDWITVSYKEGDIWKFHIWPCTTDPGRRAVKNYHNPKGVARMVPGQYRGMYCIRLHRGKYEALGQQKPCRVWRDKNKDLTFDEVEIQEGVFGINIHRSNPSTESQYVENWSEGCQVFKRAKDFEEFMEICRKGRSIWGNSFSYTLLTSDSFT